MNPFKKILIIAPTQAEAKAIGADFVCGAGAVESAAGVAQAIVLHKPKVILLAGIAGAIDPTIGVGDVVAVGSEIASDTGAYRGQDFVPLFQHLYTCPQAQRLSLPVVTSQSVAAACSPHIAPVAQIENMEGASLFAVAQRLEIEFFELRAISNHVGDERSQWDIEGALKALATQIERIRDEFDS